MPCVPAPRVPAQGHGRRGHRHAPYGRWLAAADALLAPAVTRRLVGPVTADWTCRPAACRTSTDSPPREVEVLGLIAAGLSNAEIAGELYIGETTVKTHVARILMKLGLRDRVQAVVVAYESGLTR